MGYKAVAQAEHNHRNTLYDAKRFIGKKFDQQELEEVQKQYAFKVRLSSLFVVITSMFTTNTKSYCPLSLL